MKTTKPIDDNMAHLGSSMKNARQQCRISMDEAAGLLHITPNELFEYERGAKPVPRDILQRLFIMGYKMIEVRVVNHQYQAHRSAFRKIERIMTEIQNK